MSEGASDWMGSRRETVERALASALSSPLRGAPQTLAEGMRYAALSGGKRLRPLLVLGSCAACGGEETGGVPAAVAVELIHAYSLVHDDLPAMDDDDLRRGRPTVHVQFDEATAILVGDGLQALAFEVLASGPLAPERVVRQTRTLARAAGAVGMVGGQQLDLDAEGAAASRDDVARIHGLKTGALISASFRLGAEAAGAPPDTVERVARVGLDVGLAFQIRDDVLDATASTETLGKTAGKDQAAGKATWPAVAGLAEARRYAAELVERAEGEMARFGVAGEPLRALVRRAVDRAS